MKPGMRNIKTAIAVSLSVAISRFLNMEYPFYAAIAAIISMQTTVGESFKVGRNRMLGTIVGATMGVIFYIISPENIISIGIGITIVIYICNLLGWNKSISIAGIVFCVIMTNLDGRDPVFYGLNRIFDTFIGIIIAVLVNYFIKPVNNYRNIEDELSKIKWDLNKLLEDRVVKDINIDLNEVERDISKCEKSIDAININSKNEDKVKEFRLTLKNYKNACMHIKIIEDMEHNYNLNNMNYIQIMNMYGKFDRMKYIKNKENDTVYNYHLRKIIKSIDGCDTDVIYFNSGVEINN